MSDGGFNNVDLYSCPLKCHVVAVTFSKMAWQIIEEVGNAAGPEHESVRAHTSSHTFLLKAEV